MFRLILTLKAAKFTHQSIFDHKENNLLIVCLFFFFDFELKTDEA